MGATGIVSVRHSNEKQKCLFSSRLKDVAKIRGPRFHDAIIYISYGSIVLNLPNLSTEDQRQ